MKTWLDHKVFVFLGAVTDVIWISILWYVSSLLIVTAGCASVAMYYTVHTRIFESRGYLLSTYKKAFLANLKKATVIWLICLLADAFLIFDLILAGMAAKQGSTLAVLYYPVLLCLLLAVMWQLSVMAYQARFEDTVRNVFVKSGMIAVTNLGWMLFLVLILAGMVILCRYLIFLAVLLPGGYTCLMHHVFEHLYRKIGWLEKK